MRRMRFVLLIALMGCPLAFVYGINYGHTHPPKWVHIVQCGGQLPLSPNELDRDTHHDTHQGRWVKSHDKCQQFATEAGEILGSVCPYIHDDFYVCRGNGSCLNNTMTMDAGKLALEKDLNLEIVR